MDTALLRRTWGLRRHAVAGVLAAALLLAIGDVVARFFLPAASPLVALGSTVIEFAPPAVQEMAISVLGPLNKPVLFLGMGLVGAAAAAGIGAIGRRRPLIASGVFLGVAAVLLVAVARRPETGAGDLLPGLLGAAVGLAALLGLWRLAGSGAAAEHPAPEPHADPDADPHSEPHPEPHSGPWPGSRPGSRRAFLAAASGATALAITCFAVGRSIGAFGRGVGERLVELVLPQPARAASPIPAAASVDVDGVPPFITPNDDFYRIDTALVVPELEPGEWSLRITGMVEEEVSLDMSELLDLPLEEHHVTLTCVSNPVGGDLLGTATWLGFPVRDLLARARPLPEADMVLSRSVDGFTASTPLEALTDERASLLAVGMNGEPLPRQHGFPARLVVPGLYGYVSATKWVVELHLTRFDQDTAYWTDRGWDEKGPVLVASRIDVPRPLATVPHDEVVVAGTAWAQHDGVAAVEVRVDDGDWQEVELAAEVTVDTWRQWRLPLDGVEPGRHAVTVRATSVSGDLQIGERRDPIPNAATGHHRIEFQVE
ncbi:molybdopterin-dependent oxidoreductase [Nesterenkonia xinjiangensis]|uniref:DMSO/TMAO reductase YedYZ molybdopterin-dependent catalytic subunit n=1 Tax=Nesterenkonia xinjiangensis TaxID=225327 RepID=A0A7Z0K9U3_9MICC|nr:molybdopterin-dependent oxidoreductase [Nesterenkonia xinjiangensis]NYJ77600.1 DMSO/TMAO reductase YedYZ molybdopterin-dependent catalytic subunit [Nesterenkonia xinjiangensis]